MNLWTALCLLAISYIAYVFLRPATATEKFIASMHSVGVNEEWFATLRARLRSFAHTEEWMKEGYKKYSKKNKPFVVHNMRKGPVLVLPPAQQKAVYAKPENQLGAHVPGQEGISALYTFLDPAVFPNNYEVDFIRQKITKRFDEVTQELAGELRLATDEYFGTSIKQWKTIELWSTVQRVMARGLNRVLVGFPPCRDADFLEHMRAYSMEMPFEGFFITLLPSRLKPWLGPLVSRKSRHHTKAGIEACLPLVKTRLDQYERSKQGSYPSSDTPVDILQWIIEQSDSTSNKEQMDPRRIAHRLVIVNFNLVQGGSLPFTLVLTDICSGPDARATLDTLRREAEEVLGNSKPWNRENISKLVHADSPIRDSMRYSDFGLHALPRRVSAPEGIMLDDEIRVPRGVNIEIPMHGVHFDDDYYADAATFKPFRFVDGTSKPRAAHTIEETFLGFRHGRNGCPGRFLGTHVMKVILAYFVMHYEVDLLPEKPEMRKFFEFRFPKDVTNLRVRMRE